MMQNNDFESANEKAIRFTALNLKTQWEVRNKLKSLNYNEEIINEVIAHLLEMEYIDDKKYVDAYIRQSIKIPKYSIFEIKNKLKQKGIKNDMLQYVEENLNAINYEKNIIKNIYEKKIALGEDEIKIKSYLYRRGFMIEDR